MITDVFSLVDHAALRQAAISNKLSTEAVRHFSHLLKQAIFDIFVEVWRSPNQRREEQLNKKLVQWIGHLVGPTIVSTNYDTVVEDAILKSTSDSKRDQKASQIDWGFEWRSPFKDEIFERPVNPLLRLYKLHGSLNCVRCPLCGQTYLNVHGLPSVQAFKKKRSNAGMCFCGYWRLELQIVPPSLIREMRDANLAQVWKHALQHLRLANQWFIVGYSLPPEDIAIRELLIRGFRARRSAPKVTIIQWDDEARSRFRLLFPRCEYLTGGFERFLQSL